MPLQGEQNISDVRAEGDTEAIEHLKQAVANGKHWYLALLEAIKLWNSAGENYDGRHYCYLIDGEAFDWLLLAERLCEEISQSIPEKEKTDLLFFDRPPLELTKERFKRLIGPAKYRAYLNYLYGVLVEEALILAVVNEIRKEKRASGSNKYEDELDKAYHRIYGASQQALLDKFRKEKKCPKRKSMSVNELKEFTYWLFKHRLKICDKSRVASDTKKALIQMHHNLALKKVAFS
ncbi:MAG TPA: hypothetical protein G4O12_05980 [Dehalococcoidia bacterium]|nr:hypothetical protein [Dehalococcoidia bacterium]